MNNARRIAGKILQLDYDDLLTRSDQKCCFALTKRDIAMLLAITEAYHWQTRYYSPTGANLDMDLIDAWASGLEKRLMDGCCPDGTLSRYTEDGVFQTSVDNGATWQNNPDDDPRNQGTQSPPLTGTDGPDKKCAAADNARDIFKNFRDQLVDLLTAGTTILAIVAGLVGALGVLLGLTGAATGIGVLLFGLAAGLLSLTPESVEEQLDDTVMDTFRCILYCNVGENGQFTYAQWQAVIADINSTFTGFPHSFFSSITQGMGFIGLSNAGVTGAATATDCGDCDCVPPCESADSFFFGTVNSTTDNEDGTFTFNVSSVDNGSGTQFIQWGDRENPDSPCCTLISIVEDDPPGAMGGAIQVCGSGTEIGVAPVADECYHFWLVYHDFALSTPFTMDITIGGDCP